MTVTDDTLAVCELRPGPWPPAERSCVWCGTALAGRRRRWCSDECERTFTREHNWQAARAAALERDGRRCTKCDLDPEALELELEAVLVFAQVVDMLTGRDSYPRRWARRRSVGTWRRTVRLEVNHRTPILGRHGEFGCHHHVAGLETLCHDCHLDVTAEQFGHRRAMPAPPSLFDAVEATR